MKPLATEKNILIVDDSKTVLSMHSLILNRAGFRCVTAQNGVEALEKITVSQFDLIMTDLNMPKMDGYELLKKVRATPNYGDVPVIMVSTEQESTDKMRGIEAGANLYLVKPARPEDLVANVKMLLAGGG